MGDASSLTVGVFELPLVVPPRRPQCHAGYLVQVGRRVDGSPCQNVHSTVNVQTRLNKPPVPHIRKVLDEYPTYERSE